MPLKPACRHTHPLLVVGLCPWCDLPIRNGELAPDILARDVPKRQWNFPVLLAALNDSDHEARLMAVHNMVLHGPETSKALPFFRKALTHHDDHVRTSATHGLLRHGSDMPAGEAQLFEELSRAMAEDLALRILLLGQYFLRQHHFESDLRHRQQHVIWVITNAPATEIAGDPHSSLTPKHDGEVYERAKQLWLQQVGAAGQNPAVLRNAASFFTVHEKDLCESILKSGQLLEPDNPFWSERLGHLYALQMNRADPRERRQAATKSLLEMERALSQMEEEIKRTALLDDLAKVALDADEDEKARHYAKELLTHGAKPDFWDAAGAVHQGNLVLGRLALKAGDSEQAKAYLLKAAQLPDGKRFGAFGPNMRLAKELLEKGERDVVLKYLQLCSEAWDTSDHRADQWIHEVRQGKIPAFGGNLNY
jgi:hypothetical protein